MREFETITVEQTGEAVTVTLNRPAVHNAFNASLIAEMTEAFESLAQGESCRIIVLQGAGKSFCAGADVNWMGESLELTEEENVDDALRMSDMFAAIDAAPQAVIGKVHGAALGGGMGLISVCDIVIASNSTRFGFTEARLGIIPAVISRFVVPKTGPSWARRMFLTAERFDADRAREIGLVHDVVGVDELDAKVEECVAALRMSGPRAVAEAKALIAGLVQRPGAEHRGFTARAIASIRVSPEGQEGLHAFLEKRPAAWNE